MSAKKPPLAEYRPAQRASVELTDPARANWQPTHNDEVVRVYCEASPTFGVEARWNLQIHAWVKTKSGHRGKHFGVATASMSRQDLEWLRAQIDHELRRKM